MQETIYRGAHDRVLTIPLEQAGTGTCPRCQSQQIQQQELQELEETSKIRVHKTLSGTITGEIIPDEPENPEKPRIMIDKLGHIVRV
jgi:hypothetical protein